MEKADGIKLHFLSSCDVPGTRLGTSTSITSSDCPSNPGGSVLLTGNIPKHGSLPHFLFFFSFAVLVIKLSVVITGMVYENHKKSV